jgi:hypothetical protein
MGSVGEDFVSVWSPGDCKISVRSIELELGKRFIPRDVAFAIVIENDPLAVARDLEQFHRRDLIDRRQVLGKDTRGPEKHGG